MLIHIVYMGVKWSEKNVVGWLVAHLPQRRIISCSNAVLYLLHFRYLSSQFFFSSSRLMRNLAEKMRRDKLNMYISGECTIIKVYAKFLIVQKNWHDRHLCSSPWKLIFPLYSRTIVFSANCGNGHKTDGQNFCASTLGELFANSPQYVKKKKK